MLSQDFVYFTVSAINGLPFAFLDYVSFENHLTYYQVLDRVHRVVEELGKSPEYEKAGREGNESKLNLLRRNALEEEIGQFIDINSSDVAELKAKLMDWFLKFETNEVK